MDTAHHDAVGTSRVERADGAGERGCSGDLPRERAGRREWAGLALLTLSALLVTVDFSVLNLAVPAITADLHPSGAQLLWIVDVYGFLLAGFLVPMGALGDRLGRRRVLLIGAAAFAASSVLAAEAGSPAMLIATRAAMGVAAATLAPSTLSLITTMFTHPRQRSTAIAVWAAALSIGGALGPVLGGLMLARFWWGSVFWLAVPIMVVLLVVGPRLLPEYRSPTTTRVDPPSVALSLLAVLATVYGLQQAAQDGPSTAALGAVVLGAAAAVVFVRRQRRLTDPLVDLGLFRLPVVGLGLAANMLSFFVVLGVFLLTGQYLQLVLGLSPLAAGLWSVPSMAALILGDLATPHLTARLRPLTVLAAGLFIAATGSAVLAATTASTGGLTALILGTVLLCLGVAPVTTLVADLLVSSAPPHRAGAAAALSETTTELGGALGIALLGSIANLTYRSGAAALPAELAPPVADAARDSLGGASDAVRALPITLAEEVLSTARAAFSAGLSVAAGVAAALLIVLALATLRRVHLIKPARPPTTGTRPGPRPRWPARTPTLSPRSSDIPRQLRPHGDDRHDARGQDRGHLRCGR